MATTAEFELSIPPTSPTDLAFLSGGYADHGRKYQMIPLNGKSVWHVSFAGGGVRVKSKDPNIAQLADGLAKPLPRNLLTLVPGKNRSPGEFFILAGPNPGRTEIVVEDANGKNLDTLTISVKKKLHKTFMMHLLKNTMANTIRTADEMLQMMGRVKNCYLLQANVWLEQVHDVHDLKVANDWSGLIDFDKVRVIKGKPTKFEDDVIEELTRNNLMSIPDFHMVSIPQMVGALGITPHFKNICYVANTFTRPDFTNEETTYAHELGHAFGLTHQPGHDVKDMMVEGNSFGMVSSFMMTDLDIDKVNPSGT